MKSQTTSFVKNELKELALEFKKRRLYLGISQTKLAKISSLSQSIIAKVEQSKVDPTFSTVLKIEKALDSLESISNKRAKNIMIKDIISLQLDNTILEALTLMRKHDFSQLLIFKDKTIVGVIYESSILDILTKNKDIFSNPVSSILEPSPITVPQDYLIRDLSYIFQNKKSKCVLVQEGTKIKGLITKSDIFKIN